MLICTHFISFSQIWQDELIKKNPKATIEDRYTAFENYRASNEYKKGNGFNPYAREMYFIVERSIGDSMFKSDALFIEWEKKEKQNSMINNNSQSDWIAKGPINTPIILSNGKKRGNGRVNCIAFDPNDEDIIWIGSPGGGLWRSIDGGSSWETATDNLPVIGVSSIAIDPSNTQNMLIVTGDANATDTYSIGILKSTDNGNSWSTTSLSYNISDQKRINKVIINPNNSDSVYVVTNSNIMISTDSGMNWTSIGPLGRWRDIEFKPGKPSTIYAAKQSSGGSNVYRSTDGGANWSLVNIGVASSGKYRPLIAVTKDNPEVIYALYSAADYGFHGLYKSSDSGDNWSLQSNSPNILGRETDGSDSGGQAWYDLSLGVATNNEDLVYVGGINLWRSDNSGIDWNIDGSSGNGSNYSYMHVDQHALEFNPLNNIAYAGNDGGIYKFMDNLNKWVDISDGLEISQFYRLGKSSANSNKLVAGAQDNGTEMLTDGIWQAIRGGDGMECAIDAYDEDVIYSTTQYGGFKKSYNGGNNWENIKPVNYEGEWVTPWKIHPYNNNLIVIGYDEVYRSQTAGATWDSISYNVSNAQGVKTIALAPSNQNYIYAATNTLIKVTKDAGINWTNIKPGLPNIGITDVTVSNLNSDRVWVTLSGYNNDYKVYESIDAGLNWVNITSTGLPNLPVNCIIHQAGGDDNLYVGTDIGVYFKNNNSENWFPYMTGLPNVVVKELEIDYVSGKISAATFGRGIWESPINIPTINVSKISSEEFNIYPNPAKEKISIGLDHYLREKITVSIYSTKGQLIIKKKLGRSENLINVKLLVPGLYIAEISNKIQVLKRQKLIIK